MRHAREEPNPHERVNAETLRIARRIREARADVADFDDPIALLRATEDDA